MSLAGLLEVSEEEKELIRKSFELNKEQIAKLVEDLQKWCQTQKHIPKISDQLLENFLLRNKFRLEKSKTKIENYYKYRALCSNFFDSYYDVLPSKDSVFNIPMPKLTADGKRVYVARFPKGDADNFDPFTSFKSNFLLNDLTLVLDYPAGVIMIIDWENFTFKHYAKYAGQLERKIKKLTENAYSARLDSVYFLNVSTIFMQAINQMKSTFSPKQLNTLHLIEKLEDLHEKIPKDLLPEEYGGNLGSFQSIKEKWDKVFLDNHPLFKENLRQLTETRLQLKAVTEEDLFGAQGTFKTLNLD